ncbi:transposase [Streptomyces virginiae]
MADGIKLSGQGWLLQQPPKRILESIPKGDITRHLEPGKDEKSNRGNIHRSRCAKTVVTAASLVRIEVPRQRTFTFEPGIVRKRQRRLTGMDETLLSKSARGLTHIGGLRSRPAASPQDTRLGSARVKRSRGSRI